MLKLLHKKGVSYQLTDPLSDMWSESSGESFYDEHYTA